MVVTVNIHVASHNAMVKVLLKSKTIEGKVSTSAAVRTHTMHPLTESEIRMSLSEPVLKPCSGLHGVYVTGI